MLPSLCSYNIASCIQGPRSPEPELLTCQKAILQALLRDSGYMELSILRINPLTQLGFVSSIIAADFIASTLKFLHCTFRRMVLHSNI